MTEESFQEDLLDTPYGKVSLELYGEDVFIHSDLSPITPSTFRCAMRDLSNILCTLRDVGYKELKAVIKKDAKKMNRFMPMVGFELVGENDNVYLYSIPTELRNG